MRKIPVFLLVMALGLSLSSLGCSKPVASTSKEYAKAREMWLDLLKEKRSKAYVCPEAEQVLTLLQAVDPKSLDGASAANLLQEIQKGRAEGLAGQAELEASLETARRASRPDPSSVVIPTTAKNVDAPKPSAADATAAPATPTIGMTAADFNAKFGNCFEFRNDASLGGTPGGQVYVLKDLLGCRHDHPAFTSQAVVLFNGKVESIRALADVAPVKYKVVDGKLVPMTEEDIKKAAAPPPPPAPAPAPEPAAPTNANDVTPRGTDQPAPNDVTPRPKP